jgi:putative two-component system response regulator
MEESQAEYIRILERLKSGVDRIRHDIYDEFADIRKDIDSKIKRHLLASLEIISKLTIAAELRDEATGHHIKRMSLYCKFIAKELDMSPEFVDMISYASPLHDIGKIGIPDSILLKEARLSEREFDQIKTHTSLGWEILKDSEFPIIKMAAIIAHCHHERYNGTGYPRKLKGEEIPIEARIIMIADQYDSLRSARPYKKPMLHEDAFGIIATTGDEKTTQDMFDPIVLDIFRKHHKKFDNIYTLNMD